MVGRDAGTWTYTGFLSPQEMYSIDKKFDGDLSPATGKIQSWKGGSTHTPNCTTTDLAATAEYHVTNSDGLCNFIYMLE